MCRYWFFPFWGASEVFDLLERTLSQKHTLSPCVPKMLVVYWNLLKVYPRITWMSRMTFIRIGKYSSDHGFMNVLLHTTSFVFVFGTISPIMCSLRGYWWKLLVLSSKWLPLPTDPLPAGAKRFLDSCIHVHIYIESTRYIDTQIQSWYIYINTHLFSCKNNKLLMLPKSFSATRVCLAKHGGWSSTKLSFQSWRLWKGARPLEDVSWFGTVRLFGCKVARCFFVKEKRSHTIHVWYIYLHLP